MCVQIIRDELIYVVSLKIHISVEGRQLRCTFECETFVAPAKLLFPANYGHAQAREGFLKFKRGNLD
jgi:hypothetical protein